MKNLQEALNIQKKLLEDEGYTVAYICVYGSQNYGLEIHTEDYQSDIDMKAIVVPTLDDLVYNNKPASKVVETAWGQCDIKDIRLYFQTLLKANPAYIETLFTDYYLVDDEFNEEFDLIHEGAEELLHALQAQFIRALYGMMCEKEKAMCHPYPTIAHKIEKYGFDGKQVHHIYRLLLLLKDYIVENIYLGEALFPEKQKDLLLDLKLNKITLEEAKLLTSKWMMEAKNIKDNFLSEIDESKIDYSIKNEFLKYSQDIIKNKIKKESVKEVLEEWLN